MAVTITYMDDTLVKQVSPLLMRYQFGDTCDEEERNRECADRLLRLLQSGCASVLLARADGIPAGFLTFSWRFSTTKGLLILHIQDLYTSPSFRRQGIAAALLAFARQLAEDQGAHRLQLETDTDNEAARSLYERCGFDRISHKEVYMRPLPPAPAAAGSLQDE